MLFFFFNDTATTEIYTLSLHDALPILYRSSVATGAGPGSSTSTYCGSTVTYGWTTSVTAPSRSSSAVRSVSCRSTRSEEHTSELQSRQYLVCRLLLEKKNTVYCI